MDYNWSKMGYAASNRDDKCEQCGKEFKAGCFTSFICQGGEKCALKEAENFKIPPNLWSDDNN